MSSRQALSVVLIAKNAADLLPECLESVSWADEIVLLDRAAAMARRRLPARHGAKVFTRRQWHGYGKQRQQAQSYASHPMILMIDSDERVTPEQLRAIDRGRADKPRRQQTRFIASGSP